MTTPTGSAPPPATEASSVAFADPHEDLAVELEARWRDNVASVDGLFPGAVLGGRIDLPSAVRWLVQTRPGSTVRSDAFDARRLPRLAAALGLPSYRIQTAAGPDESTFSMTVLVGDALADGVPFDRPRHSLSRVTVGQRLDGIGGVDYVAYSHGRARNGLATGGPGSGATVFLEGVGLGLRSSGEWYLLVCDGDPGGGSSPLLNQIAHHSVAGAVGALVQLESLERALTARALLMGTMTVGPEGQPVPITDPWEQPPLSEFRPSQAFPAVQWIIDDLDGFVADSFLQEHYFPRRLELLTRRAVKYGIGVLVRTSDLLLPAVGWSSTGLKENLASGGNVFAFRSSAIGDSTVDGHHVNPGLLPPGGGYAYHVAESGPVMLRVAWSPDMRRWARGLPVTVLDTDTARALAPRPITTRPRPPAAAPAGEAPRRAGRLSWLFRQRGGR